MRNNLLFFNLGEPAVKNTVGSCEKFAQCLFAYWVLILSIFSWGVLYLQGAVQCSVASSACRVHAPRIGCGDLGSVWQRPSSCHLSLSPSSLLDKLGIRIPVLPCGWKVNRDSGVCAQILMDCLSSSLCPLLTPIPHPQVPQGGKRSAEWGCFWIISLSAVSISSRQKIR